MILDEMIWKVYEQVHNIWERYNNIYINIEYKIRQSMRPKKSKGIIRNKT